LRVACSCHEGKLERTEWVIYQSFNLTTAIAEVHMSKRLDSAHLCLEVNVYTRRLGCFLTWISQTLPASLGAYSSGASPPRAAGRCHALHPAAGAVAI